ncbi:hypothetical protein QMG83_10120 [Salinibacterium sp. G-O1]|uniref:hypothetical protein n=1 Tax=Salinibacterium sp. G-O1 TaxID=3046208 RepID=UPI0024B9D17F|nr:hypothetical protein [Salinibacterium sp. G-O1]MDJ0335576.1 hypothetical protein [Salinibacterium sp. G-O1]
MFSTQRATSVVLSAAIVVGLGGCSLIEPQGTVVPLTGLAACAQGNTWNLDMTKLAETVKANIAAQGFGVEITTAGKQVMVWDIDGAVVIDSDYTLTITSAPAPEQVQTVTTTHVGKATGASYITENIAIPRDWDATGTVIKTVGDLDGTPIDPVPFSVLNADLNDSVGVELTCDGETLTTHPRGSSITQTWTKG